MFQPAARFRQQVEKDVLVVRQRSPERFIRSDDTLEIFRRARTIEHAGFADIHQVVRLRIDPERMDRRVARDDGGIHERVVVGRDIVVLAAARGLINVGAPLIIAKSTSTQFERTVISWLNTRYVSRMSRAPPVVMRQRFLTGFATSSCRPPADATSASIFRSYSRIKYEPGVHVAM